MENNNKIIDLFVPGRLCLFGEHSDWAGRFRDINADIMTGQAIVTGIDLGLYATAKKGAGFTLRTLDENGESISFYCPMEKKRLEEEAAKPTYFCYACGVAAYLIENYQIGGLDVDIYKSTLPVKKGLSSSAAICVLIARAFNELYQLHISTNGEMQIAFRGELMTSSRCGRLDQACAYGVRPVCMEFDGERISVEKLNVGKELYWVFADLNAKKDTKRILSDLNSCFPFPQNELGQNVQEALGKDNHAMIAEVKKAIGVGDAERIGVLMMEAQKLFDEKIAPACPQELTAPILHKTLHDPVIQDYIYGGKGVGSQGDGTIQFIAKDKQSQKELVKYMEEGLGMHAHAFTLLSHKRVRKAIIPMAGYGSRMYPASRFIKKAFFPVIDENGFAKPVLMVLLEELDRENLEEIILIVGESEQEEMERIFEQNVELEYLRKLPKQLQEYERTIARVGSKLRFVVQKEKRGFGHAVAQAGRYLEKDEPVLLLLGDFIYRSKLTTSCMRQTINAYTKSGGQTVVSIKEIPLAQVSHYGCLAGEFQNQRDYLMNVSEMKEKPSIEYAKDYLGVVKNNTTRYYGTFGQYILTPEVFEFLEEDIKAHVEKNDSSEIELTTALQRVCEEKGVTAVLVDGESYDVGMPQAYMETVMQFSAHTVSELSETL